jgi:tetratricopeptide (TPR) repeat protein
MTPRQTRAQRLAMPLARHVVRDLAAEHGCCLRPVQLRRTELDTGQVEQVLVPCGHTLASVCPSCAVTADRQLADTRPDAFLPNLARSLNNQSACLSELGRREDALAAIEEAVTAYRQLADTRPDAFLPDLAGSLSNQSRCLSELGRREDALAAIEEAVTIRRRLADARPAVFGTRLASSLRGMAVILAALGKTTEADAATAEAAELE